MARFYYLGPWVWDTSEPEIPHYRAPTGTIGLVDLRPVSPVLTMGFFATDRAMGGDYIAFGDGVNRLEDIALTPQQRSLWSSALGIGSISGNRLIDALWETLTLHGDPDGGAVCRPLMPTHKGILELHLGGHSLIRSEQFTGVGHPAWPKIQALVQRNYRAIRTEAMRNHRGPGAPDIHSKYLKCMRRKLRCPWELLIPGDLPKEPPRRPTTTITESFNQADSTTLGPDLTWAEVLNDFTTISNEVSATDPAESKARAESNLSSDDHYSQLDFTANGADTSARAGPVARFDASANTNYFGWNRNNTSTGKRIRKTVTGTDSDLATGTGTTPSFPTTLKLTCDGSSLELFQDGGSILTVTDTAITGNVRCGVLVARAGARGDNFEAADLVAAGESRPLSGPFKGPLGGPFG